MTKAYFSTVLDYPLDTVWSLIRDFNNYPAYIDGVTESVDQHVPSLLQIPSTLARRQPPQSAFDLLHAHHTDGQIS